MLLTPHSSLLTPHTSHLTPPPSLLTPPHVPQAMENAQLRRSFGLDDDATGVRVRGTVPLSAAAEMLQKDDLILRVQGHAIANDGSFAVGAQERLSFVHLIHLLYPGEQVELLLWRDRQTVRVSVPVAPIAR